MTKNSGAAEGRASDFTEHPAVVAWKELNEGSAPPAGIQVLRKPKGRPNVFRLIGAGPERTNVIAKRCLNGDQMVERQVYEGILPRLPVSSPSYYGHVKISKGGGYWLFIEDAGDEAYLPQSKEHQALVPGWLAELHTSAPRLQEPPALPDRSASWFLGHLRLIHSTIAIQRPMWAHLGDDVSVFEKIVSQYDALESRWHEVQSVCERAPFTLVHCDFVPKNICVRSSDSGKVLLPFDWEVAGWGNPATDIAHLIATPGAPLSKSQLIVEPDCPEVGIEAYWTMVQEHWPQLSLQFFERLAVVGQIFRLLLSVGWALKVARVPLIDEEKARVSNNFVVKNECGAIDEPCANWLLDVLPLYESRLACMLSVM